ncbi:MucR family transcriptional regulator [Sphingomonas sp. BIUV-7]|uniref:MucR family transcriptional regulator n=2 Tax=Sphingomonas natans TaxID=3063330 RepID=A0ABT8Y7Q0_9SPHN|nr:MucR family transcriptional regulator [Sphingomonas sp. BIUV-7]MDO6414346.1 MucR family transcriptional regulator [Sphingomonas sp. BIUV-7]
MEQRMADADNTNDLITLTADIVSAHVANNSVHAGEIANLIATVHASLSGLGTPAAPATPEKPKGAVSARASVKPGHLISMIDGKPYKMLRRHISQHGYTPESYREAFDLARDYPMVASDYAEQRRALAHKIGLGRKPKAVEAPTPAKRGRKPKGLTDALDAAKGHLEG